MKNTSWAKVTHLACLLSSVTFTFPSTRLRYNLQAGGKQPSNLSVQRRPAEGGRGRTLRRTRSSLAEKIPSQRTSLSSPWWTSPSQQWPPAPPGLSQDSLAFLCIWRQKNAKRVFFLCDSPSDGKQSMILVKSALFQAS